MSNAKNQAATIPGLPLQPVPAFARSMSRREALSWLGRSSAAVGGLWLAGCQGGTDAATASTGATSASTASTGTTSTGTTSSGTTATGTTSSGSTATPTTTSSGSTSSGSSGTTTSSGTTPTDSTYASATNPWTYKSAGTSTTATVPALADFVTVLAAGTKTYTFHNSVTSTTTDPVTGVTTDTTTSQTLVPYLMNKYQVTNANWKAFCNAMGSTYYPSTAKTSGRYWSGGAYPAGKETHPVLFVSLTQAQAFCAWLETQISGYDFYVPTEGEWEYAAMGDNTTYHYPWGTAAQVTYNTSTGALSTLFNNYCVCTQWVLNSSGLTTLSYYYDNTVTTLSDGTTPLTNDTAPLKSVLSMNATGSVTGWQYDSSTNYTWADFANSDQFGELSNLYGGYTTAVGSFPNGKSWCGLFDVAGNVHEWTSTLITAGDGVEKGTSVNAVKGGSWYALAATKTDERVEGRSASGAYNSVGFRVAARPK